MGKGSAGRFVSRGGEKLDAALRAFEISPAGWVCADLGCNTGGFTDCLLSRGARRVYAVDTGYGALAWTLRRDHRVVVMERCNALHTRLAEPVELVVVDVGWTRQHLILRAALELLTSSGVVVSLVKPHYEAERSILRGGVLADGEVAATLDTVARRMAQAGIRFAAMVPSPIRGHKGNCEFFGLLRPQPAPAQ